MKIKNILIGFDEFINTILGGYPGETMSTRCWRLREYQPCRTLRPVIDFLFSYWGPNHCEDSFKNRGSWVPADNDKQQ